MTPLTLLRNNMMFHHNSMLRGDLNRKPEFLKIEPLTVTWLTRKKDRNHQNHQRLRVTLTNAAEVEDVLLASHSVKSDKNASIPSDIPYSELNLIRNILRNLARRLFVEEIKTYKTYSVNT